jgi:hypothetical protein
MLPLQLRLAAPAVQQQVQLLLQELLQTAP